MISFRAAVLLGLASLIVASTGCRKKEEPVAEVVAAPAPPPPPPPPPPKVYPELIEYIPSEMTLAIGLRPQGLDASKFGQSLVKQFEPVMKIAASLGIDMANCESIAMASGPNAECLIAIRLAQPMDVKAVAERWGAPTRSTGDESPISIEWGKHPHYANQLGIPDDRTYLVGRKHSVEQALAKPPAGPIRVGYDALKQKEGAYWTAGDQAAATAQAGQVGLLNFEKTVKELVGFRGFASVMRFSTGLQMEMSFVLSSDAETASLRQLFEKPTSTIPNEPQPATVTIDEGEETGRRKDRKLDAKIPEYGAMIAVKTYRYANVGPIAQVEIESPTTLISIGSDLSRAQGQNMMGDGIFAGLLPTLAEATRQKRQAGSLVGTTMLEKYEGNANAGYSWMCHLLPYFGHQEVFDQIDFKKDWHENPELFALGYHQIGEFLNPANQRVRWKGYPYPGHALTHFVGVSGYENKPTVVAAKLPRTDPRAGIFGYDRVAKDEDITDGTSTTMMLIGNERLPGPWMHGGGATVRGVRKDPFNDFSGFHSEGLEGNGAYVLMADGSARVVSADVDPKILQAMSTMHGGETVDLQRVPTLSGRRDSFALPIQPKEKP